MSLISTDAVVEVKHKKCYDEIKKFIMINNLSDGEKLPSEKQLTEILKVSRITVRRAISDLEADGLVKKVHGSGTFVTINSNKAKGISYIPLVLPGEDGLYDTIRGINECFSENSCYLTPHFSNKDSRQEREVLTQLVENGAKHIIVFPYSESENQRFFLSLENKGIHLIFLDRMPRNVSANLIQCDNIKGGYLATDFLFNQGYRRIAFYSHEAESLAYCLTQRVIGYKDALIENQLSFVEDYVSFSNEADDNNNDSSNFKRLEKLMMLDQPPDAIFCATDITAVKVLGYLGKLSLSVPDDVAIIGFDDSIVLRNSPVMISTIAQPFYNLGYEAAKTVCEILDGDRKNYTHKILPVELVVRDSTPMKNSVE